MLPTNVYEAAMTDPEADTFFSRNWKERPNENGRFFLGISPISTEQKAGPSRRPTGETTPYIARVGLSTAHQYSRLCEKLHQPISSAVFSMSFGVFTCLTLVA
ncbi:MAG TPA: hypothetical protein VH436_22790, partial [Vicinamibacterales bacterium]